MLQLKNVSKAYKPKKGAPVQALKDISLSFEDKGIVFVLGKSGSGKSTLLNLIGGLDFADSGEIIIDSKSSKDFNEIDYDSYRNTYIGFVFQEYNVLNEFTVGENISLALELQEQKSNKQKVEEILKEVEMEGYVDRKPNELSGGQRQRVAIARAIVKSPKIIMADEPTGALDSETGKAIFDTLKRLSQDRLVIVVSHDREFAEQYGDRIIELADGQVINDERKVSQSQDNAANTTNVVKTQLKKSRLPFGRALAMGAKTLKRKKIRLAITIILCFFSFTVFGLAVTSVDYSGVDTVADYLVDMYQDGIIVSPALSQENYKNKISVASYNDLQKLKDKTGIVFQGVVNNYYSKGYSYYDKKVINNGEYYSKDIDGALPATQEFFDTLGYKLYGRLPKNDKECVVTKYIYEKMSIAGLVIKNIDTREDIIIYPKEIADIQSFLNKNVHLNSMLTGEPAVIVGVVDTNFDPDGRFDAFKNDIKFDMNDTKSYYLYREFQNYIKYGYFNLEFVNPQAYDNWVEFAKAQLNLDYVRETDGSVYLDGDRYEAKFAGVASDDYLRSVDKVLWIDGKGERRELANNEIILGADIAKDAFYPPYYYNTATYTHSKTYFDGLVSLDSFIKDYEMRDYGAGEVTLLEEAESISLQELEKYKDYCKQINFVFGRSNFICFSCDYREENIDINLMQEKHWRWSYACYLKTISLSQGDIIRVGGYYDNVTGRQSGKYIYETLGDRWYINYKLTTAPRSAKKINPQKFEIRYNGVTYSSLPQIEFVDNPVIVGVYFSEDGIPADFVINNKMYEETEHLEKSVFSYLIAPRTADKDALKKLAKLDYDYSQARGFGLMNYGIEEVTEFDYAFAILSPIFFIGTGVLGLFSILLMGSYIATSINGQKRQIGILRAMGATKKDIFAIFANESAIIAGITLVLSVIGTFVVCIVFNAIVSSMYTLALHVLHFGILQVFLLALVSIGVAVIASAIPLYKLSKKKPVDSIQDR